MNKFHVYFSFNCIPFILSIYFGLTSCNNGFPSIAAYRFLAAIIAILFLVLSEALPVKYLSL